MEVESPLGCCGGISICCWIDLKEQFLRTCTNEFKDVMERLELVDFPLIGGKWTWSN